MTPAEWLCDIQIEMDEMRREAAYIEQVKACGLITGVSSIKSGQFLLRSEASLPELQAVFPPTNALLAEDSLFSAFPQSLESLAPSPTLQEAAPKVLNLFTSERLDVMSYWSMFKGRLVAIRTSYQPEHLPSASEYRESNGFWLRLKSLDRARAPLVNFKIPSFKWEDMGKAIGVVPSEMGVWMGSVLQTVSQGASPSWEDLKRVMPVSASSSKFWDRFVDLSTDNDLSFTDKASVNFRTTLTRALRKAADELIHLSAANGVSTPWSAKTVEHMLQKQIPGHVVVDSCAPQAGFHSLRHCDVEVNVRLQGPLSAIHKITLPQHYSASGFDALCS